MTADTIDQQLVKYLADAHSIESQALVQMKLATRIAGAPGLAAAFRAHDAETQQHRDRVAERLAAHGGDPSRLKELVMQLGGGGFAVFAALNADTPGKLTVHGYSYEHLEEASYELLKRVAERQGDAATATMAAEIAAQEAQMGERLAGLFDEAVEASLAKVGKDELDKHLVHYLQDIHGFEEQAIKLLTHGKEIAGDERIAAAMEAHREESVQHERLIRERLSARGAEPSRLKDVALGMGGLTWGSFFQAHPDTPGKLVAFSYAFEHLEIAAYELLQRVAAKALDTETVTVVEGILSQERAAAATMAGLYDVGVEASLAATVG